MILKAGEIPTEEQLVNELSPLWEKDSTRDVEITFAFRKKPRSTGYKSQNHHLNGHIKQICEETGNDFSTIKHHVKMQSIKRGYRTLRDEDGYDLLDIYGQPIPISESDCTSAECTMLIDEVHILASELGIILREE